MFSFHIHITTSTTTTKLRYSDALCRNAHSHTSVYTYKHQMPVHT